jgi:acetolactate synthase-1/2/3 large subunit
MISVADYVAKSIADYGIKHVFMVTGGGAMFLNDAFGSEPRIRCVFNHHEQACAMAAEGYARVTNQIGVINVTSGPGSINALNGVFGAWTDSIPMLIISGQVKRETLLASYDLPGLRQLGDQEVDIIRMVKGITKYCQLVIEPGSIRYHLEKAIFLASNGRPGPCWLDIPVDVQSAMVEESELKPYDSSVDSISWDKAVIESQVSLVLNKLQNSKRPVILAGTGVRLASAVDIFNQVIHKLGIPVTTAWTHDLIATDDPLFCGRPGSIGTRAGNFVVQNADTLLVLGSRLNLRQVSYNWQEFAKHALKIQVDIDPIEMNKPTVTIDHPILCDVKVFLEIVNSFLNSGEYINKHGEWLKWCKERNFRFPPVTPEQRRFNGKINPYYFMETLFGCLDKDDVIVTGNGSACVISFQTANIKKGQRLFSNSGSASMGYDLPAAIGAAFAQNGKRVICLAGEGSIQMNIQELQTIFQNQLNIKVFVLNNNGYLSIRTTQKNFFGRLIGESPQSGLTFPDIIRVGKAYGLYSMRVNEANFEPKIIKFLKKPGPCICDVVVDPDQSFEPRLSSLKLPDGRIVTVPLEDMYPFLDRKEYSENILYKKADKRN